MDFSTTDEDEDGDETWRAAVNSVAVDFATIFTNGSLRQSKSRDNEGNIERKSSNLRLCQARVQDLLHGYLDKTLIIMADPESQTQQFNLATANADDDIRLFRQAPPGISFKPVASLAANEFPELLPRKKPRIYPRHEIDEKSTKFRSQLQSVAVDGAVILATAERENARSFAQMQAKDAAAWAAAKREEERVALLKQQRGEKWLPAIAREMFGITDSKKNNMQNQHKTMCQRLSNNASLHKNLSNSSKKDQNKGKAT